MSEPMTTAGLQAKVQLRRAWFEAHPNQPIPEAREQVEALFLAIEEEARAAEGAAAPAYREALAKAVRATVGPWFDEGYDNGRLNADVLADRVLAAIEDATPAAPAVRDPELDVPLSEYGFDYLDSSDPHSAYAKRRPRLAADPEPRT